MKNRWRIRVCQVSDNKLLRKGCRTKETFNQIVNELLAGSAPSPRFKDVWHTYWSAVRMMFLPMLAVTGGMVVRYFILHLIFMAA